MRGRHLIPSAALGLAVACAGAPRMGPSLSPSAACRDTSVALRWIGPLDVGEQRELDARCLALASPIHVPASHPPGVRDLTAATVAIVTWNLHDGRGDLRALLRGLDALVVPRPDAVVLLLQEAVRGADAIDTIALARRLGWHVAYAPARPIGTPSAPVDVRDRGVAIVSSLPLSSLSVIELPVERQRRLALAATVFARTPGGCRWTMRIVNAHLENRAGLGRMWVRSAAARARQAQALLDAIETDATVTGPMTAVVVGGDFNTWLGRAEGALRRLTGRYRPWPNEDTRPTHAPRVRLDRLFGDIPSGAAGLHRRLDAQYGSDHHPVVATVDFGASPHAAGRTCRPEES